MSTAHLSVGGSARTLLKGARMFGVGHQHVEQASIDQDILVFGIESKRLIVVGERVA